jgi:hypothetical protein
LTMRRLAALLLLLVSACSLGGTSPRASSSPGNDAVVRWLRGLDRTGTDFSVTTRVAGGPVSTLVASGHLKRGEIDMTSGSVHLVIYDGVLYGAAAGSKKWLDMPADPANFLWPAACLSLLWESIQLSRVRASPFPLAPDQLLELGGALKPGRGEVQIAASLKRIEVTFDGTDSVFVPRGPDAADVQPPASAVAGNVLNLLAPGTAA